MYFSGTTPRPPGGVEKSDLARQLLEQAKKTTDALDCWAL